MRKTHLLLFFFACLSITTKGQIDGAPETFTNPRLAKPLGWNVGTILPVNRTDLNQRSYFMKGYGSVDYFLTGFINLEAGIGYRGFFGSGRLHIGGNSDSKLTLYLGYTFFGFQQDRGIGSGWNRNLDQMSYGHVGLQYISKSNFSFAVDVGGTTSATVRRKYDYQVVGIRLGKRFGFSDRTFIERTPLEKRKTREANSERDSPRSDFPFGINFHLLGPAFGVGLSVDFAVKEHFGLKFGRGSGIPFVGGNGFFTGLSYYPNRNQNKKAQPFIGADFIYAGTGYQPSRNSQPSAVPLGYFHIGIQGLGNKGLAVNFNAGVVYDDKSGFTTGRPIWPWAGISIGKYFRRI